MQKIHMRDKVKDTVTGFEGVVIGRTEWLNGCIRYAIQAPVTADGKLPEAEWIDDQQLEVTEPYNKPEATPPRGGPMPKPKFHPNPSR